MTTTGDLADQLLRLDGRQLVEVWNRLDVEQRRELWTPLSDPRRLGDDAHRLFIGNPTGWIETVLGEGVWSLQHRICEAIAQPHASVAVPSAHSTGKSHIASRLMGWWGSVWPPSIARSVSTATNWTQVEKVLWSYLGQLSREHSLPGDVTTVKWKRDGQTIMWGFSVAAGDDTGAHGVHAAYVLIVIDEASGIEQRIGDSLEGLQSSGDVRVIGFGNPSPSRQGTWFEQWSKRPSTVTIPIPAEATPNFTGEETGWCSCHNPLPHRIADHLVTRDWVDRLIAEYGAGSPIVRSKVEAKFPTDSRLAVISIEHWEACKNNPEAGFDPPRQWIGVGVDVAAGGGDELVVVSWRPDGEIRVDLTDSSQRLRDPDVAGELVVSAIEQLQAEETMKVLAADPTLDPANVYLPVWVKWDADGVGWGLQTSLQAGLDSRRFYGEIIGVRSGARASDRQRYVNRRAEMWWQAREAVQEKLVKLPVDHRLQLQATRVEYRMTAARIRVETKDEMRKRFGSSAGASPDRADAFCLAIDTMEMPAMDVSDYIDPAGRI